MSFRPHSGRAANVSRKALAAGERLSLTPSQREGVRYLGSLPRKTTQETRTNKDFAHFIEQTAASDPNAKWTLVLDNLNTHSGEALVGWVAQLERIDRFIAYDNPTLAWPMNGTDTGRPTEAKTNEQLLTWRQQLKPKRWKDHWSQHHQLEGTELAYLALAAGEPAAQIPFKPPAASAMRLTG